MTSERDSLLQQNVALAATTSRLMGAPSEPGGTSSTTTSAAGAVSGVGDTTSPHSTSPDASAPSTSRGMTLAAALAAGDRASAPGEGPVLTPGQAREIGALLSRLTRENAAFLKARDAVLAERDVAQERVLAMEMEVEMLQQQLQDMVAAAAVGGRGGARLSAAASGRSSAVASPRDASRSSSRLGSLRWRSAGVAGGSSSMATMAATAVAGSISRSASSKKRVQLILPENSVGNGSRLSAGGNAAAGMVMASSSLRRSAEQSEDTTPPDTGR